MKESSDFRLQNTDISDFTKALACLSIDDLQVIDNSFNGVAVDACSSRGSTGR